jgi:hypothetical protein
MADFAAWATACETALWPAGTFMRAYGENRRAAIEEVIDGDPVADLVRAIVAKLAPWKGTASDLLRIGAVQHGHSTGSAWPKSSRALAGRLRRVQPLLRPLGIEIAFVREGQRGTRFITLNSLSAKQSARVFQPAWGDNVYRAPLTD